MVAHNQAVYASVSTAGAVMLAKVATVLNKMVFVMLMPAVYTAHKLVICAYAMQHGAANIAMFAQIIIP
jgi:hypothetical protein